MRQWTVDAFAAAPFKGNPACVVEPFAEWPDDAWMQALAKENNQAETAFLRRMREPDRFELRWFTPGTEVPLCGHATLGSAHVLFTELGVESDRIEFVTRWSGSLFVRRAGVAYEMDFPADPPRRVEIPAGIAEVLGAEPSEAWAAAYFVLVYDDAQTVRRLKPDVPALIRFGQDAAGGPGNICVAALDGEGGIDVVDRFFGPGCGIAEDPTTGSMHCILAPLFSGKLGKPVLDFLQAFPGRGGEVQTEMRGDRVLLRGKAITVIESVLRL